MRATQDHPYQILYVDDEQDNLTAFRAVFRRYYKVHLAQSGTEALEILEKETIDLIISDQRMPEMTGVELFEKIKDDYPDIIRMVLTGYSDMQAIIDAINKGKVYHYISKPWKVEELKVIIDKALETYTLKRRNRELETEKNELLIKSARQEKEQILAQFEILKNQINPHFLFNSMNILSSLISVNSEKAILFTTRFSKLYRSLLGLQEQLIISLREELDFVKDYIFLQKMRFEDSLQIDFQISAEKLDYTLPPFALQILVENAIKHNIVSEDNPLKITFLDEGDQLIIKNNLQLRGSRNDSTGIGLKNLSARYQMIGNMNPEYGVEEGYYVARIPILEEG